MVRKYTNTFIRSVVILLLVLDTSFIGCSVIQASSSDWYHANWDYRIPITLTNPIASYPTQILIGESQGSSGYQVQLDGHVRPDFGDLRVTGPDGLTPIQYWIDTITGTYPNQLASVWIKNTNPPASSMYLYYGDQGATSQSNNSNMFTFFDGFDSSSLANWNTAVEYGSGTATASNGTMILDGGTSGGIDAYTKQAWGTNYAVRLRLKTSYSAAGVSNESARFDVYDTAYGYMVWFDFNGGTYPGTMVNYDGSFSTLAPIIGWKADTYGTIDIIRNGSTDVVYRVNDITEATISTHLSSGPKVIDIECVADSPNIGVMTIDYALVRPYASPEPSLSFGDPQLSPSESVTSAILKGLLRLIAASAILVAVIRKASKSGAKGLVPAVLGLSLYMILDIIINTVIP